MCFLFYCFILCIVLTVFNFIFNQWQENKDTPDEERVDKTPMRLGFVNCCSRLHVSCLCFLPQSNLFCGRTRERSPSRRMPSPPEKVKRLRKVYCPFLMSISCHVLFFWKVLHFQLLNSNRMEDAEDILNDVQGASCV